MFDIFLVYFYLIKSIFLKYEKSIFCAKVKPSFKGVKTNMPYKVYCSPCSAKCLARYY